MLRHTIGLLAGLVVTPLLWIGIAWSATRVQEGIQEASLDTSMATTGVGVLMAVGVVCGYLAGARISPLAALLSGGAILAFCLWPLLQPDSLNAVVGRWNDAGSLFHPVGPALPVALPVGTLLFISALPPSRWRRNRPEAVPPAYPGGPTTAVPPTAPQAPPETGAAPPPANEPSKTTTPFQRGTTHGPGGTGWAPGPTQTPTPPPDDSGSATREFGQRPYNAP